MGTIRAILKYYKWKIVISPCIPFLQKIGVSDMQILSERNGHRLTGYDLMENIHSRRSSVENEVCERRLK